MDPRASCAFIAEKARHVTICPAGVQSAAESIFAELTADWTNLAHFCKSKWTHPLRPSALDESTLKVIVLCAAWNYCFWPNPWEESFGIRHKGALYMRSWAMVAAIDRSIEQNKVPLLDPEWQIRATLNDLRVIFREEEGCGPIPLLEERLASLHQLGKFTMNNCGGNLANLIRKSEKSAAKLMQEIIKMSMWNDRATFQGKEVQIMKRTQLVIADLWYCAHQTDETNEIAELCKFDDIDILTAFADYRIPQSLAHLGVIRYSDELTDILKKKTEIAPNDAMEIEVRGVSVEAIERIRLATTSLGSDTLPRLNSVMLDTYLWSYAMKNRNQCQDIPHHQTRTYFY